MASSINNYLSFKQEDQRAEQQALSSPLPLEILEMVATLLPPRDLENFSRVSKTFNAVALRVVFSEKKAATEQLQVLSNLDIERQLPKFSPSTIEVYKSFLNRIRDPKYLDDHRFLAIAPDVAPQLQIALSALFYEKVPEEFKKFKGDWTQEISKHNFCIRCLDKQFQSQQDKWLVEALNDIFHSTLNPRATRDLAVYHFGMANHIEMTRALIEGGNISGDMKCLLLEHAAITGLIDLVISLLPNKEEDAFMRGWVIKFFVQQGNLKGVQALLASGPIKQHERGIAVNYAVEHHRPDMVEALLKSGPIYSYQAKEARATAEKNAQRYYGERYLDEQILRLLRRYCG